MLGAVIGDIVGSIYEFHNIKTKEFELFIPQLHFTDDTVMTAAVFEALRKSKGKAKKLEKLTIKQMQHFGKLYPHSMVGYGKSFAKWLNEKKPKPYNSFGNGSAMRISPVAYFAKDMDEVKNLSKIISSVSHNHPEGIRGAEAIAAAIFLLKNNHSKENVKNFIQNNYYNLNFTLDEIRPNYKFDSSCQGTVPQAMVAFLESNSFEDALRNAISIGGDSDTLASIAGALAHAHYGIPKELMQQALSYLDERLKKVIANFNKLFN